MRNIWSLEFWPRYRIKWMPDGSVGLIPINDEALEQLRIRNEIERWIQKPSKGSENTDGDKNSFTQVNDNL